MNSHLFKKMSEGPQVLTINEQSLTPLPLNIGPVPAIRPLSKDETEQYEYSLDGVSAICLPRQTSVLEKQRLVQSFLSGLRKLLSQDDNWTFWQPLMLSLDNCVGCNTCSSACPIYEASGHEEIYRPNYRAEIIRKIRNRFLRNDHGSVVTFGDKDIKLNWSLMARLAELAYRCTLCGRCAQVCPMGVDNGLITREIRKLFSQEMGIAPKELHEMGTVAMLKRPAIYSTQQMEKIIDTIEDGVEEKIGRRIKLPIDKTGADFLFIQTSLESPEWLECPECFSIIFDKAGFNWTFSSELGLGGSNFGLWYDDIQFSRIVHQQIQIARKLKVKRIVLGECGHAFKAMAAVADRILPSDLNIQRVSWLPLVAQAIASGQLETDPRKNDFVVTMHDPCNIARYMGLVTPQRQIMKQICRDFREINPCGVSNYCCGGGSGLVLINGTNFSQWRAAIAGRTKMKQILDVFDDCLIDETRKYVCAPCFTCKLQLMDLFNYYRIRDHFQMKYGGLVELVVNAMVDIQKPIIDWGIRETVMT